MTLLCINKACVVWLTCPRPLCQSTYIGKEDNVNKEETRGRKMRSDNVRVIPEFREQIDIDKLCNALIEIAKSIAKDKRTDLDNSKSENF